MLSKLDHTRRLLKWVVELNEFNIFYTLRTVIKAQVLADFLADFFGFVNFVGDNVSKEEQQMEA